MRKSSRRSWMLPSSQNSKNWKKWRLNWPLKKLNKSGRLNCKLKDYSSRSKSAKSRWKLRNASVKFWSKSRKSLKKKSNVWLVSASRKKSGSDWPRKSASSSRRKNASSARKKKRLAASRTPRKPSLTLEKLSVATLAALWSARVARPQRHTQVTIRKISRRRGKVRSLLNPRRSRSTGKLGKKRSPNCKTLSTALAPMCTKATVSRLNRCSRTHKTRLRRARKSLTPSAKRS
mmetsp:Transcript_1573/g.2179  ORF Transcript_1573/g.2179 Transcript_1573/m.2179 type:complete len:233 (-) Transcript_1573:276-974(-)